MIVKDADQVSGASRQAQAGARAERDIAFYLRRAIGDHRSDVFVFNDLRLQHDGEVAQIDHLVVHVHGMFIIESKSVSGEIHILPDGQFVRLFGRGQQAGMPSPVLQAHRQADILRRLLQANKAELRERKLLGLVQGGFTHCPIEVRVAISDRGIIRGEKHAPEVRKADAITQDVEDRIGAHRRGGSLLNIDARNHDGDYSFTAAELDRLRSFLLAQHVSRAPAHQVACPAPMCKHCHSPDLQIVYGRFGYYFKCQACEGNTPIDTRIEGSARQGRVRKSGREFYLVCAETGKEWLIFRNAEGESAR